MVFDVFLISLMSVECERVFFVVGYFIIGRRNAMKEDIIEVIICLRAW